MNDTPQARVMEIPVTERDRAAMLYKHAIETPMQEVGRTEIAPGLIVVARRGMAEVYRHEFEGVVKIYDVRKIKDLIYEKAIPTKCLRVELNEAYVQHVYEFGGCEQDHVDRITNEDIVRPAIGVFYPEGLQIVDGSHRIVARWRRFNKRDCRILCVPGEHDPRFLVDESELVEAPWMKK